MNIDKTKYMSTSQYKHKTMQHKNPEHELKTQH